MWQTLQLNSQVLILCVTIRVDHLIDAKWIGFNKEKKPLESDLDEVGDELIRRHLQRRHSRARLPNDFIPTINYQKKRFPTQVVLAQKILAKEF